MTTVYLHGPSGKSRHKLHCIEHTIHTRSDIHKPTTHDPAAVSGPLTVTINAILAQA